jgi:probable O-glycosylation ligase (exosortase A-associated)
MKQTVLMLVLLTIGTGGALVFGPFLGVAVYYLFAVLRPQYMWEWALLVDLRWSLYVAIVTILSTGIYFTGGLRGRTFTSTHAAFVGFALWLTMSSIFALNTEISSYWYWEYFKIVVMFFCATLVVRELSQIRILYLIAVWALAYIAYEINFLYLFSGRLDVFHQGYGGLDNNGAGLMIAMGVPMAYFLWQYYRAWWRWIFLALIPMMVHAVLMTYSRGAMLSLLLVSPLLIVRSPRKRQMIFAMVCCVLLLPVLAGQEIRARFFSIEQYEKDRSAESRFGSWKAGLRIASDYPVFGAGVRNSTLISHRYGADMIGRAIHSQYIQTAADSGFPALAFYSLLLFGTWRGLRRTQKRCRDSDSDEDRLAYNLACGIEGALAVFCIGTAFLSLEVFELPYLLILLGLKLSLVGQEEPVAVTSPSPAPKVAYQPQNLPA